jgi:methionyl-tRNA formyltransferase
LQLTVAIVAEQAAGVRAVQLVADRGHRIAAVFTTPISRPGLASLADRSRSLGVTVCDGAKVRHAATADWLRIQGVQLLLNVHSLHVLDARVLEAPSLGAYNLHPGPLPERAGLNAPSWALYEGAESHGVTLHRMTPQIDAGAIAFADTFQLREEDTGLTVTMQCVRRGIRLIEQLLEAAENGGPIPARPQDLARRRWYPSGPPEGGRVNWGNPARKIADFVRACDYRPFPSPWGFARCSADAGELGIVEVQTVDEPATAPVGTVERADGRAVMVAAGDALVRVDRIEIAGEVRPAAETLRTGTRMR